MENLAEISENTSPRHSENLCFEFSARTALRIFGRRTKNLTGIMSMKKIEPYLCGDDAEVKEIADDVEMFVHARYAVR